MGHWGLARFRHETRASDTTQPDARADAAAAAGDSAAAAVQHGARARAEHGDRIEPPCSSWKPTQDPDAGETDGDGSDGLEAAPKAPAETAESANDTDDGPLDLDIERSEYRGNAVDEDGMEPQDAEIEDLRDHLLWQLNLTPMSVARPRDRGDDHRGDRRRRLSHRIGRSDPVEPRIALLRDGRADRVRAPSRAALRSGGRCEPLAEGLPRACSSIHLMRRRRRSRSRKTIVSEHLEALARQDRIRLCQRVHATEEEFEARRSR